MQLQSEINSRLLTEIKKILVIRLSSFGDIILSFPLLKLLRFKYPEADIHFLTKRNYSDAAALNPHISRIIELRDSIIESRKEIKKENYDLILDIHKNYRSIFISIVNGKKVRRYQKDNLKKFFLVKFKWNLFREIIPVYRKYILALNDLDEAETKFSTTELIFEKEKIYDFEYSVISPSSKHFTKTYPADKFISYINSHPDEKFILTGDVTEKDKKICGYIESRCSNTINLCGKLDISKLAGLICHSKYVICNDSAILHLSEALGKEVNSVFGSTVKEFGFFPQLKESKVFEVKYLECRPCSHIGRDKCPKGHFKCMEENELKIEN